MTRAQANLIAEMGPFTLTESGDVLSVHRVCLWGCNPPVMPIDRAAVAALNHVADEEKARQTAKVERRADRRETGGTP